jgi:hypothetical protein
LNSKAKDLGTYHLRVEFADGTGYIHAYYTGQRFTGGDTHVSPLEATRMPPVWESEEELFHCMEFEYLENNHSCDCNRKLLLARAYQQPEPEDLSCGETIILKRLTAIRPDGSEVVLFPSE